MKNLFLLLFVTIFYNTLTAQVGINTDLPEDSAILDINSGDKGILFPRMDLENLSTAAPVRNPATGLIVWNTDDSRGGADKGLYYWDGAWNKVGGDSSQDRSGSSNSFGQVTLDADLNTRLQQYTFTSIDAPSSGFSSSDVRLNDGNQFSIRPETSGIYRVSFTVTYRKTANNGADNIEFYLFRNNNAISDAKVTVPLTREFNSVSFSKLIRLDAYQYYGIGISASGQSPQNLGIEILRNQTQLNIEKID